MRWTLGLALLTVTLAGCAQDEVTSATAEADATAGGNAIIRGVVVDQAVRPLHGARVVLVDEGQERHTDEAGAFLFDGLRPSVYTLEASHRFHTTVTQATVADTDAPSITLVLDALPQDQPYVFQDVYQGHLQQSIVAGSPIIHCCQIGTSYPMPQVPTFLQTEVLWEKGTDLAEEMDLGWYRHGCTDPADICQNRTLGPSPLVYHRTAAQIIDGVFLDQEGEFSFRVLVADRSDTRPPSVCLAVTCTAGVGAAIDQPFEVYTTAFFNFRPPDGWLFVRDGLPEPA